MATESATRVLEALSSLYSTTDRQSNREASRWLEAFQKKVLELFRAGVSPSKAHRLNKAWSMGSSRLFDQAARRQSGNPFICCTDIQTKGRIWSWLGHVCRRTRLISSLSLHLDYLWFAWIGCRSPFAITWFSGRFIVAVIQRTQGCHDPVVLGYCRFSHSAVTMEDSDSWSGRQVWQDAPWLHLSTGDTEDFARGNEQQYTTPLDSE